MAPQDDLTAERAAKLYSLLHATISHDGIFGPDDIKAIRKMEIVDKALIIAALQAARQEALREVLHESLNLKYYHAYNGVQALHDWVKDRLASEGA